MTLPKIRRIKKEKDFKEIFSKGKTVRNSFLFIRFIKNNLESNRITVTISAKIVKKAVDRNRIRRRVNNFLRFKIDEIFGGHDIIFIITKDLKNITPGELKIEIINVLKEAKLI